MRTAGEACFYVDLEVSLIHDFHLDSREDAEGGGVTPHVHIAEYGPLGRTGTTWWISLVAPACAAAT
jgi:hypothetical protein